MEELEGEKRSLEARRERLELPAIDKEMLRSLVNNFEKVMAEDPNPKKKHLLHQLVKKVLIHRRDTIEVWYSLPIPQRFADCNILLPECTTMRTRPGWDEREVYFRIVCAAGVCHHDSSGATYREQTDEIFMVGPKGVFENGNIGAITRRAPPDLEVSAVLLNRGDPKPPWEPKAPPSCRIPPQSH